MQGLGEPLLLDLANGIFLQLVSPAATQAKWRCAFAAYTSLGKERSKDVPKKGVGVVDQDLQHMGTTSRCGF